MPFTQAKRDEIYLRLMPPGRTYVDALEKMGAAAMKVHAVLAAGQNHPKCLGELAQAFYELGWLDGEKEDMTLLHTPIAPAHLLEPRGEENVPQIEDHWTVERVGDSRFCLEMIDLGQETAQLHATLRVDGVPKRVIIDYEFPSFLQGAMVAVAKACPLHEVGFGRPIHLSHLTVRL